MNLEQLERMQNGKGFVAALDQSGGSTPKALALYGVDKSCYRTEREMFEQIHQMRIRIMTSPAFSAEHILGAILFAGTMRRCIGNMPAAQYLWKRKIVPFLKIDQGMEKSHHGVQLMKPITGLDNLLLEALDTGMFGTKMRSFIEKPEPEGIRQVVRQQFEYAEVVARAGLVPIIEPEVSILCEDKISAEELLYEAIIDALLHTPKDRKYIFKLTIPTMPDLYSPLPDYPQVVRVLALSGGYTRADANNRLRLNHHMIASFSRALTEGLSAGQTDEQFNATLEASVNSIYSASLDKKVKLIP